MPQCEFTKCRSEAEFEIAFRKNPDKKFLACDEHYRYIVTGKFCWVRPLRDTPLKKGDESRPAQEGELR